MNKNTLAWLGFSPLEINIAYEITYCTDGDTIPTIGRISRVSNVDYETATRIRYLCMILSNRTVINLGDVVNFQDMDSIQRHFKKMFGDKERHVALTDLMPSKISEIPRVAVVSGITEEPYSVFNSKSLKDLFIVDRSNGKSMVLRTNKKVVLRYKRKGIYGVEDQIEVRGKDAKGRTVLEVNKEFCRLCNRYAIVASLRSPREYLGAYAIINKGGDTIYVYAKMIDGNKKEGKSSSERIYDYGIKSDQIETKITVVAQEMYKRFNGVYRHYFKGNIDYSLAPRKVREEEEDVLMM